jgi:hypothetical protein
MIILRVLGGWALIAAIIALVYDGVLMARGTGSMMSLSQHWLNLSAGTMAEVQTAVERVHPMLWSPITLGLLAVPAWLFFALLGTALYTVGRRRRTVNIYAN